MRFAMLTLAMVLATGSLVVGWFQFGEFVRYMGEAEDSTWLVCKRVRHGLECEDLAEAIARETARDEKQGASL
jgi:hypothetical protein